MSGFVFILGKPKTCKTDAKETLFNPNPDQECIFPFSYEGKQYQKCSRFSTGRSILDNICATKTQGEDNELLEFGMCSKACDKIGDDDFTSENGECNISYSFSLISSYYQNLQNDCN